MIRGGTQLKKAYCMELAHPAITSKLYELFIDKITIKKFSTVEKYIENSKWNREYIFIVLNKDSLNELRNSEIKKECYIDVFDLAEKFDKEKRKRLCQNDLILWGVGETAEFFLNTNKDLEIKIFMDSDISKIGTVFHEKKVINPQIVFDNMNLYKNYKIICCSVNYMDSMKRILDGIGWDSDSILGFDEIGNNYLDAVKRVLSPGISDYCIEFVDNKYKEYYDSGNKKVILDDNILSSIRGEYKLNNTGFYEVVNKYGDTQFYAIIRKQNIIFWIKLLFQKWIEKQCIGFYEVYPAIGGIIFDGMNDVGISFVECCKKYDIKYKLIGKTWEIYEGKENIIDKDEANILQNKGWKKISSSNSINDEYMFLYRFIDENYAYACFNAEKYLDENGIASFRISIPYIDIIAHLSEEEEYCNKNGVYPYERPKGKEWEVHLSNIFAEDKQFGVYSGQTWKNRKKKIMDGYTECYVDDKRRHKHIFFVGPCISAQIVHSIKDTIIGNIQMLVGDEYSVVALHFPQEEFGNIERAIKSRFFIKDDIVIFAHFDSDLIPKDKSHFSLNSMMNNRDAERWWFNVPIHLLERGSKKVAEYIYRECIESIPANSKTSDMLCPCMLTRNEEVFIANYLSDKERYIKLTANNGAIVMNCNPFTEGHRYLIEQAASKVNTLYLFVVEEDRSYFSFNDRYEMVKRGVQDIDNIVVLPSGNAILSMRTLPAYFTKEEKQEEKIDASYDLKLFALGIAPAFGIGKRFVGEEPIDKITKQYNCYMKDMLPHYGIELVEIPRKECHGKPISASRVRDSIKSNSIEAIRGLVPNSTYQYLKEFYRMHEE